MQTRTNLVFMRVSLCFTYRFFFVSYFTSSNETFIDLQLLA